MHGKQETSQVPRVTCTVLHAAMVAVAAWIYYGGGAAFFSSLVGRTKNVRRIRMKTSKAKPINTRCRPGSPGTGSVLPTMNEKNAAPLP